ncbi:hypothetical protein Tco_1093928 [Tanacetum coccineum]|uniref:Uncharacterized protein n=1 Tax=Tanacetum coccineum TaxID=301880 RepID=A0ABQ5IEM3_9ASTR
MVKIRKQRIEVYSVCIELHTRYRARIDVESPSDVKWFVSVKCQVSTSFVLVLYVDECNWVNSEYKRVKTGHLVTPIRSVSGKRANEYHMERCMPLQKRERGLQPLENVQSDDDYNVFAIEIQHSEQPEFISYTYLVEKVDSNVTRDSSDMCTNEWEVDKNVEETEDERVLLASLVSNLKLNVYENKKIQKQLKNANTSLTQELEKNKRAFRD